MGEGNRANASGVSNRTDVSVGQCASAPSMTSYHRAKFAGLRRLKELA